MIDPTKFYLRQFRKYLDEKYGDSEKVPKEQYWEEFYTWTEENAEDLLKQYEEYCQQFIYKGEK